MDTRADALGLDPDDVVPLPHCTPYVTEWDQDERGFYVGAWVAVVVSFGPLDTVDIGAQPGIEHHFTFSGIAIKDIPIDLDDATVD